jgi:hypothetical protein
MIEFSKHKDQPSTLIVLLMPQLRDWAAFNGHVCMQHVNELYTYFKLVWWPDISKLSITDCVMSILSQVRGHVGATAAAEVEQSNESDSPKHSASQSQPVPREAHRPQFLGAVPRKNCYWLLYLSHIAEMVDESVKHVHQSFAAGCVDKDVLRHEHALLVDHQQLTIEH